MNISHLATIAAQLKEQMKKKPCKRCRMRYDPKIEDKCPYCGDLDRKGLKEFFVKKEREFQGNRQLGRWFIIAAIALLSLMLLVGLW